MCMHHMRCCIANMTRAALSTVLTESSSSTAVCANYARLALQFLATQLTYILTASAASQLWGHCSLSKHTLSSMPHMLPYLPYCNCCPQVLADWAKPSSVGSNIYPQRSDLDMLVRVFNSSGQQIASLNPTASLTAGGGTSSNGLGVPATDVPLPSAGLYYVSVAGTGSGSATTTGYTDYGSLGQYALTVTVPASPSPSSSPSPSPSPSPVPSPSPSPEISPSPSPSHHRRRRQNPHHHRHHHHHRHQGVLAYH